MITSTTAKVMARITYSQKLKKLPSTVLGEFMPSARGTAESSMRIPELDGEGPVGVLLSEIVMPVSELLL